MAERKDFPIDKVMGLLKKAYAALPEPIVTAQTRIVRNPFKVLISTMISLRTKDEVTAIASENLYKLADTPEKMLQLKEEQVAEAIYPAGFYKTKAKNILEVCRILMNEYKGKVPEDIETLVTFPGVGRKTANLVRTLGYELLGICVDTHVHRITNRWGYIETKNPDKTEMLLREILPKKYWIAINDYLVAYGQNICSPVSPHCSKCTIAKYCAKTGVNKSR